MKNKIFKSAMALAFAGVMAMGAIAPISAVTTETQTITENKDAACEVVYTQESSFSVKIPKTVTLDASKESDYEVNVTGDISSDKQVSVTPDATFAMVDQSTAAVKKDDVTATVTQEKTIWTCAEVAVENGTSETGNISATDLTAGSWKGTFNFAIALEDVQ